VGGNAMDIFCIEDNSLSWSASNVMGALVIEMCQFPAFMISITTERKNHRGSIPFDVAGCVHVLRAFLE
jgi:hypothetical protein